MASNQPTLNRFVSPGPGGCVPVIAALCAIVRVVLGRRRDEDGDDA